MPRLVCLTLALGMIGGSLTPVWAQDASPPAYCDLTGALTDQAATRNVINNVLSYEQVSPNDPVARQVLADWHNVAESILARLVEQPEQATTLVGIGDVAHEVIQTAVHDGEARPLEPNVRAALYGALAVCGVQPPT
jgi:hypothetical protein